MKYSNHLLDQATYQETEITHLRQLIWSNLPDNDLLALEIVRNRGLPEILIPEFTIVALTAEMESVKIAFLAYLESTLDYATFTKIKTLNARYFTNINFKTLSQAVDIDRQIYTYFKRTSQGLSEFLIHGSTTSPLRKEMFQLYLEDKINSIRQNPTIHYLDLNGLTEQELKHLLEEETIAKVSWRNIFIKCPAVQILPKALFNFQSLTGLSIIEVPLLTFPVELFQLTNLYTLHIASANFDHLPKDWSALKNIVNLSFTDSQFKVEDLSFVSTMPKLKTLELGNSTISSPHVFLREKTVPIDKIPNMSNYKFKNDKQFLSLCSAIERAGLPRADKEFFVDYFAGKTKLAIPKSWNWSTLLKATNIPLVALKRKLMAAIDEKVEKGKENKPITKSSVLYITGTPTLKITALKKLLKELELPLVKTYTDKVTHVIIGMKSPDFDLLANKEFTPISDVELQKISTNKQPQFLKESIESGAETAEEITKNLEQLIQSTDLTNVKIGLEMIKKGGLPMSVFDTLLVVQKTTTDAKIRKAIKAILEIQADAEWKPLIRDRLSFKIIHNTNKSGIDIRKQFVALAKKVSPTIAAKFSFLVFKQTGKGLRYALTSRIKAALKKEAYQLLLDKHHFDFSKGLAFSKRPTEPRDYYDYSIPESSVALPVLALELGTIYSLNLTNCRYEILDEKITKFKDLKQLNLAINELSTLPKYLTSLTNLETIDLRDNDFKEFPRILAKFPKLKKVDLRGNEGIFIPNSFAIRHPDCIVLI